MIDEGIRASSVHSAIVVAKVYGEKNDDLRGHAGRKSSWPLVRIEAERRLITGEAPRKRHHFAEQLFAWFEKQRRSNKSSPPMTVRTIENNLKDLWKLYRRR